MIGNCTSLVVFVAVVIGVLIVPSMVQARSRTGSDVGTRLAELEQCCAELTARTAEVEACCAGNAAAIDLLLGGSDDALTGDAGDDTLIGSGGDDTLTGSPTIDPGP